MNPLIIAGGVGAAVAGMSYLLRRNPAGTIGDQARGLPSTDYVKATRDREFGGRTSIPAPHSFDHESEYESKSRPVGITSYAAPASDVGGIRGGGFIAGTPSTHPAAVAGPSAMAGLDWAAKEEAVGLREQAVAFDAAAPAGGRVWHDERDEGFARNVADASLGAPVPFDASFSSASFDSSPSKVEVDIDLDRAARLGGKTDFRAGDEGAFVVNRDPEARRKIQKYYGQY